MAASRGRGVLRALFILLGAAVVMLFVTSLVLFLLYGRGPAVPSGSTLVVRVGGDPPEVAPFDVVSYLRGPSALTVRSITTALSRAKVDERIQSVLVESTGFTTPYWGKVQEIRDAVADFKASGKPVYAYLEYAGERDYYLATAADKVFLMPSATLDVTGVATNVLFLRGTLDKAGVQADLHRIGAYKTAVNQYTETTFTDAHREMDESINRDWYDEIVETVAEARGEEASDVREWIDQAPLLPDAALQAGLVDGVAYEDEVEDELSEAAGDAGGSRVDLDDYVQTGTAPLAFTQRPRIAVIYAAGVITGGESGYDPLNGAVVGADTLIRYIRQARRDDRVKAIVLRVDSPGGSAVASDAIWHELMLAHQDDTARPLVASMGDLAASGGYYIAMAADAIVAQPSTLTGSIGIFGGKYVLEGAFQKVGANLATTSIGRHAEMQSPARPYTPEEVEVLDAQLQAFYADFVDKAAASRGVTAEAIDAVGQGRVWTGRQALERGLVDELGGLDRAIALARARANIPDDQRVEIVVYPPRRNLLELLSERMSGVGQAAAISSWLPPADLRLLRALHGPLGLFRRGELLALMPERYLW